ncbi:MAG: hypothetical protein NC331_11010 [Lachnospiraceae bacterium]|nr:hypothetical protein [Lachnospiraceae bacterium]MCM1239899.1 hypothetical protein [Lachnospiraceae bacterium]
MSDFKSTLLCVCVSMQKAVFDIKALIALAVGLIFQYYTFCSIPAICEYLGCVVTPWLFPFYISSPTMFIIVGSLGILLYSDAPFMDGQSAFLMIRTGRRNWIWGQILYIWISALLYAIWNCLGSLLFILPYLSLEEGWGAVLWTMADNPGLYNMVGTGVSFVPAADIMDRLTPLQAMFFAVLLYWLGTALIGMIILFFRVRTGGLSGTAVCGALTGLAYFSCYLGPIAYGYWLRYLSPVSWFTPKALDMTGSGQYPSLGYALMAYLILLAVLTAASLFSFCRGDVSFQDVNGMKIF